MVPFYALITSLHCALHGPLFGAPHQTEGFADGGPDRILMSYHPPGGTYRPPATSTGEFYHDKSWLDFNMIQSGHRIGNRNYLRIAEDYARTPVKPTIESEPCYEDHPVKHDYKNGRFGAWHMRRRAYWALFAGACGYTYGGNGIWQMDKPGQIRKQSHHHLFWYDALDLPGAGQMKHVRALVESRPLINPMRMPDQSILLSSHGRVDDRIQCCRAADSSYWMLYVTNGRDFSADLSKVSGSRVSAWWYNPRTGQVCDGAGRPTTKPFSKLNNSGPIDFDPPGKPERENDWILVLDDVSADYPTPDTSP